MERCPSELWTRIFELACTDGGRTGCYIARTSRYFREAVLSVQLHSVALCTTRKMAAFADFLEQREPGHRRVRHLFLSCLDNGVATTMVMNSSIRNMDHVLFQILTTVAPYLLTLTSNMPKRVTGKYTVLHTPFPCLMELTIIPGFFYPAPSSSCVNDYFPSLRYLDILSTHSVASLYASRAPRLTHLRLSVVDYLEQKLQESLAKILAGTNDTDEHPEAEKSHFPSTIQKITIHRQQDLHRLSRVSFNRVLHTLALVDKDHKLDVASDWTEGRRRRTRGEWEDRITGGYGCWSERVV